MAKSHYSFKKRKKEMARKLKQEEKRQRKLEKNKPAEDPDNPQDENQDLQAQAGEPDDSGNTAIQ
jgi:hypothetical protein